MMIDENVDAYFWRAADLAEVIVPGTPPAAISSLVSRIITRDDGESTDWKPLLSPLYPLWRKYLVEAKICEAELSSINLAISTDEKGHSLNATLIHIIVRSTHHLIHVRCYCRGFAPESFYMRNLLVEFIRADADRGGDYPWWDLSYSFDRLRVI